MTDNVTDTHEATLSKLTTLLDYTSAAGASHLVINEDGVYVMQNEPIDLPDTLIAGSLLSREEAEHARGLMAAAELATLVIGKHRVQSGLSGDPFPLVFWFIREAIAEPILFIAGRDSSRVTRIV